MVVITKLKNTLETLHDIHVASLDNVSPGVMGYVNIRSSKTGEDTWHLCTIGRITDRRTSCTVYIEATGEVIREVDCNAVKAVLIG